MQKINLPKFNRKILVNGYAEASIEKKNECLQMGTGVRTTGKFLQDWKTLDALAE